MGEQHVPFRPSEILCLPVHPHAVGNASFRRAALAALMEAGTVLHGAIGGEYTVAGFRMVVR